MRKKCKKKNVDYKDPTKRAQACRMIMHEMEDLTGRTMKVQELSHTFKNLRDTEDAFAASQPSIDSLTGRSSAHRRSRVAECSTSNVLLMPPLQERK